MPGRKYNSIRRPRVYRALRRKGMSKSKAAAIANSGARGGRRKKR